MHKRRPVFRFLTIAVCTALIATRASAGLPATHPKDSPALIPVCLTVFTHECGLLDRKGHWAVEPRPGNFYAMDDVWVTNTPSGRAGLLDAKGQQLIAPGFEYIGHFRNGIAPASRWDNPRMGYIDIHGNWVLPQIFEAAAEFSDGVAAVRRAGQTQDVYIDPQGAQAVPGTYERAGAFAYGVAEITRGEVNQQEIALIDRQGRVILPWMQRYHFQAVLPDRVVDDGPSGPILRNSKGEVLFTTKGGGEAVEGRLFYTLDDGASIGLLDLQTAKPVVEPRKDWQGGSTFSDGVAWVHIRTSTQPETYTLIDRQGRDVLPAAQYESVMPFADGVSVVRYPGKGWQLIDRQGHALIAPVSLDGSIDTAWDDSAQTPRAGDVWQVSYPDPPHDLRATEWVDLSGRKLVSVKHIDCGIQVVLNGAGETIWPRDVAATCAVARQQAGTPAPEDAAVPADRIAAVRLAKARESVDAQVDVMQRESGRTGLGSMPQLAGPPPELWNDPAWQHGPRTVRLAGPASLVLPAGFRYLAPEAVRALRDRLVAGGMMSASKAKEAETLPMAILAPDDATWKMSVLLMEQGHIDTDHVDLDPETLRKNMEDHTTNILAQTHDAQPTIHNISWVRQPRWDASEHRLDWIYKDFTIGGAGGGSAVYLATATLGRRWTAAMQIVIGGADNEDRALIAQESFDTLIKGVTFDAGETYADVQPGDKRAALGLTGYIEGPQTPEEKRFPEQLQHAQERHFWSSVLTRVLPVLALGLLALGVRGRGKRK
ncbi:DUF2167 domain-containing protein [Paraburkholderia fungorum]|uniref:DUF2167 domain-containing protein n=1 Tax=Paraburkholderia fungorum TaxID=134537 RepID=UPI0038BB94A5